MSINGDALYRDSYGPSALVSVWWEEDICTFSFLMPYNQKRMKDKDRQLAWSRQLNDFVTLKYQIHFYFICF